jgi:hypothetical protein
MKRKTVKAFLSQPYGRTDAEKVYWNAFQKAIQGIAAVFKDPTLEIQVARQIVKDLSLKRNVMNIIDDCDFTIAVITGSNPNVFWEIGYSESQHKPVVLLVDERAKEAAKSPVLIHETLTCSYAASALSYLVNKGKAPPEFAQRLGEYLKRAMEVVAGRPLLPIARIEPNREACALPDLIAHATTRVYLITTNLSYFADFERFAVEESAKRYAFDPPAKGGVDVQVLTLDPDSPVVKYRAEQLGQGHDVAHFREGMRDSAQRFYRRYINDTNVTVRIYD